MTKRIRMDDSNDYNSKKVKLYHSYLPEFVGLYEIKPYIIMALDNESIRVAVKYYLEGGFKKDISIMRYGAIEDWNVSQVTDMNNLFGVNRDINYDNGNLLELCKFNEDISKWDVSNVTDMSFMFDGCVSFNQPIGCWKTSKVTDMRYMFCESEILL